MQKLTPVLDDFPFDTVTAEAEIRQEYLESEYYPAMRKQANNGKFEELIDALYLKKIGAWGEGRSGAVAEDFISLMKKRAKYTGRMVDGKLRPMSYFLGDLSVTHFPPDLSIVYQISGSGITSGVVSKAMGCLSLGIKMMSLSYNHNSPLVRCSDCYIHIPQKIDTNNSKFKEDFVLRQVKGKHAPIDVMGNSFETAAYITSGGNVEGIVDYHETEDISSASKECVKYIKNCVDYIKHLNNKLPSMKLQLTKLGEGLSTVPHIRMASSGDGAASLKMAMSRLAHTGRDGFSRSIDFISSDNFGPPGYADIQKDDGIVISSGSLQSSHTIAIGREATNIGAKLYLITSELSEDRLSQFLNKYKIKEPDVTLVLPFSTPRNEKRFYDLGVRHVLEYLAAATAAYLGLSSEDMERFHIQKELQ